jgi:pheromone a factor receptor
MIDYTLPIILEFISGVYGCLSIRAFYNCSRETHLNNMDLDSHRYINLMCFSVCDLLIGIPITSFYLYYSSKEFIPYPGLTQEHYNFSYIPRIPAVDWRDDTLYELSMELNRWILVLCAFLCFAIIDFTEESRKSYRAMLQSVVQAFVKITGINSRPQAGSAAEGCVILSYFSSSILRHAGLMCYLESCSTTRIVVVNYCKLVIKSSS